MRKIKISIVALCLSLVLSVCLHARPAIARDGQFNRQEMIGQELDCVEQNIGENGVSWSSVCYTGSSVNWDEVDQERSAEQYYSYSENQRDLQQRKLNAISQSLDDWDQIERRHANLIYDMDSPSNNDGFNNFGSDDFLLNERYARENVRPTGKKHTIGMDWEIFAYKYEEPDVMQQDGIMNGFSGKYTYRPDADDLLHTKAVNAYRLESIFAFGDLDYQADERFGGYGNENNRDYYFDLRVIIGKEFIHSDFDFMVYSGFGFRYLNDEEPDPILFQGSLIYGYERESHYKYIPFGFELTKYMPDNWSLTFNGEYDKLIVGWQNSNFSGINKYLPSLPSEDVTDRQDSGYGFRGSVRIAKSIEHVDLYVEPFFRYWNIDDSEIKSVLLFGSYQYGLEPKNNTVEGGVKLGVQF